MENIGRQRCHPFLASTRSHPHRRRFIATLGRRSFPRNHSPADLQRRQRASRNPLRRKSNLARQNSRKRPAHRRTRIYFLRQRRRPRNRISGCARGARCRSRATIDVLPSLQSHRLRAAATLGLPFSPSSLRAHVRSQFLARSRRLPRSPVELTKLSRAVRQSALLPGFPAYRAHRRVRDPLLPSPRLPARLLPLLPRRPSQGSPLPTRDRPSLGQLSRTRLRLENDSRQRRRAQRLSPISPHHARTRQLLPLQPLRCRPHAHTYLHALCFPSHLRRARAHSPPAPRSLARPRRRPPHHI